MTAAIRWNGIGRRAVHWGLLGSALAGSCWACNVPVFRYALERWHPEEYELVVFHRGPLPGDAAAIVKALDPYEQAAPANYILRQVDLAAAPDEPSRALWNRQADARLPWVVLCAPASLAEDTAIWAGPLDVESPKALLESPARAATVRHLQQGETAVWILLESGQAEADAAASTLLARELKQAEQTLKLPEPAPDDPPISTSLPLTIRFSVLRVSRADPAEAMLVRLLGHGAGGAWTNTGPVAYPVFGRGRVLAALSGAQLTAAIIRDACAFLCGICSCEVKELNPGKDLLLAAQWDEGLDSAGTAAAKPALPVPVIAAGAALEAARAAAAPAGSDPGRGSPVRRRILLAGMAASALVVLVTGVRALRGRGAKT
jgi:hypothetical protein